MKSLLPRSTTHPSSLQFLVKSLCVADQTDKKEEVSVSLTYLSLHSALLNAS